MLLLLWLALSLTLLQNPRPATGPTLTAPPAVQITFPTSAPSYDTIADTVTLRGVASSTMGVRVCAWTNSAGGAGFTTGTNQWEATSIPLSTGGNTITIACVTTTGGYTGTDVITVTRTGGFVVDPSRLTAWKPGVTYNGG